MLGLYHWIVLGLFGLFALVELAARGRDFPPVTLWRLRGLLFLILYLALATYSPLLWDEWLGAHRLVDATGLPLWVQVGGGFLLVQFGIYVWHRTMHNVGPLWRHFHQMHHSAERIDIWSAFLFHPLDTIAFTLLASLCLVLGLGISGDAALIVAVASAFLSMFTHLNASTPRWLGFIVARPESHTMHHERGVHARNYGDVPWFDMLFGTFHNPRRCEIEVGFYDGASGRFGALLAGKAVA